MDAQDTVIYDPISEDPTQAQLNALDRLSIETYKIEELCNPESIKVLLTQQKYLLLHNKKGEKNLEALTRKHDAKTDELSDLKVKLAESRSTNKYGNINVLVSILAGFSLNILVIDPSNIYGWVPLFFSAGILYYNSQSNVQS